MDMRPNSITITFIFGECTEVYVCTRRTDRLIRRFDTAGDAAEWAAGWISDRGYRWAYDTAQRVDDAQRRQSPVLVLNAV